MEGIGDNFKLS